MTCLCGCGREFVPRRGGSPQKFASGCRAAFYSRARREGAEKLTRRRLKNGAPVPRLRSGIDGATGRRVYLTAAGWTYSRTEALWEAVA